MPSSWGCFKTRSLAADFFISKVFIGSNELIKGLKRYCLWISDENLSFANSINFIRDRIAACKTMRLSSRDVGARKLAEKPHQFREFREANHSLIVVPSVSSENRAYLPIGIEKNDTVISNLAFGLYDCNEWVFSILCSKLHLLWIKCVCGQLETRIRYSNTLGWNTFPFPNLEGEDLNELEKSARKILLTREKHYPKSIADLYDSQNMPDDLRNAHIENDQLLESFYCDSPFESDEDRLSHLFERYVEMTKGSEK